MSAAFSQALSKGLGPHLVPQSHGDPNYYATIPTFDSRGFWHSAGSNPPAGAPKGNPATPAQGEWVRQGTTTRNGQATSSWIWYPPKDKRVTFGSSRPGEHNYIVSRTKLDSAKQVFSGPEYWVHEYVVASPPQSSYHPQALEYDTVEGIVPVVGAFHCQHWLLVVSQNDIKLNATLPGGLFSPEAVFNYYAKYVGVSPYFTWNGYLFKFEYTGYDPKTGKYRQGGKYIISICTDGLNVQKNPAGDVSNYTVYPPGSGSGGVLVVHQPRHQGVGHAAREEPMQAFNVRGLGRVSRGDSAFSPALLRGLGRDPEGLGQLSQFTAGSNGVVQLTAYDVSALPKVHSNDWIEFYPNDPGSFRLNTNLALNASEQASSLGGSAFYGANPVGGAIVSQVISTASSVTTYWSLVDPNNRAVYTIGAGGNVSGDGSSPGIAIIRSSFDSKGALKLEIAIRTAPRAIDQFDSWPDGATLTDGSALPSSLDWAQLAGPVGGDLTGAVWPGQTVALVAGGTDITGILNAYLQYLSQPEFLQSIPSQAWGPWAGFGVPRGGTLSVPTLYFTYGSQVYKVFWYGGWIRGQVGGAPNAGPAISVAINMPKPKPPPTLPGWATQVQVPPAKPPAWLTPVKFPGGAVSPASVSAPVTGAAPVAGTVSSAALAAPSLSTGAAVALGPTPPVATSVTMTPPVAPGAPLAPASPFANVPTWAWVLGGAALAGLIGFIIWSATRDMAAANASGKPNPLPAAYRRRHRRRRAGYGRRRK